jgi:glucosamine--fructose-6-phosphate aminotransferase (isomerizing)
LPNFGTENISDEYLSKFEKIFIVACGTAMHAGIIGKTLIEKLARIPVEVEIASEFRYKDPVMTEKTLVIVISQSGETADTLASLRLAKSKNISTIAVVNVIGSSISREADKVINTFAGPEISVASTKAYSVQVATMYLLAIRLGLIHGKISQETALNYIKELVHIPNIMKDVMDKSNEIKHIAGCCQNTKNMFFLGRGLDYALSLEGALKLKEISYIHCEPYAAGELKHGTISLITDNVPVVCIVTQKALAEKMISNVKEVKSRGALTIFLVSESINFEDTVADYVIRIPDIDDLFSPLITIVALQLFAYHMAVIKGCDVDKPRNLAKSVTVE